MAIVWAVSVRKPCELFQRLSDGILFAETTASTGGSERFQRLSSRPGAPTGGIFKVPDLLVRVIVQTVDMVGRRTHTLVVPLSSPLDASRMDLVDRFSNTIVGVIVEMEEVGHDIDLVVDVALSALQVP